MKSMDEARERTQGLYNICVTPFSEDGTLKKAALEANLERVIGLGFDGILIGGTYGEFPAMSTEERATLFRAAVEVVGDRVPLLLCSAAADPRAAVELTQLAADLGGLPMVTAPYVSEITDAQIVSYFKEIAKVSRTGIMIYNAPGIGITLSAPLIEELSDIEGMIALKQGDLSPTVVDRLVGRLKGKLKMLAASDLAMLGPIMTGFDGLSSTNSCALPEIIHGTYKAVLEGDFGRATSLNQLWYPVREACRAYGQPQTTKAMMALRGWDGGVVRAPLRSLSRAQHESLAETLRQVAANTDERLLKLAA
ncbi:dihydrodipicolinate synthase family protein [Limibacillus sp. MBR-115]|uniref:dihydrodipicolinate synthase family protein n=1 Tax=Limibacillus sp. MBR-115 TaxID=3156465 RepID=UPI00339517E5